jgi:hypothetical protein
LENFDLAQTHRWNKPYLPSEGVYDLHIFDKKNCHLKQGIKNIFTQFTQFACFFCVFHLIQTFIGGHTSPTILNPNKDGNETAE